MIVATQALFGVFLTEQGPLVEPLSPSYQRAKGREAARATRLLLSDAARELLRQAAEDPQGVVILYEKYTYHSDLSFLGRV